MFLVSDENMVVSASLSGGIGAFPAFNYRPMSLYRQAIKSIKARTSGPIAVNVIIQRSNKYQQEQIDIALEEGVELIISWKNEVAGSSGSIACSQGRAHS